MEEDDQKRSEQAAVPVLEAVPSATTPAAVPVLEVVPSATTPAAVPVLEAVPSATTPAMDAPPAETMPSTETALIAAEPTGAGLGMPKESLVVPGPSTV